MSSAARSANDKTAPKRSATGACGSHLGSRSLSLTFTGGEPEITRPITTRLVVAEWLEAGPTNPNQILYRLGEGQNEPSGVGLMGQSGRSTDEPGRCDENVLQRTPSCWPYPGSGFPLVHGGCCHRRHSLVDKGLFDSASSSSRDPSQFLRGQHSVEGEGSRIVTEHVGFEEKELIALIERLIPEDQLQDLASRDAWMSLPVSLVVVA